MNGTIAAAIQNTLGAFIQLMSCGAAEEAARLFTVNGRLEMQDEKLFLTGRAGIAAGLRDLVKRAGGTRVYHIPHSPAFRTAEDGLSAQMYCESATYFVREDPAEVEFACARFDGDFAEEDGSWKLSCLRWYFCQSFLPVTGKKGDVVFRDPERLDLADWRCGPEDQVALQNLLGAWCAKNRKDAAGLFVQGEDVCLDIPHLLDHPRQGRRQVEGALEELTQKERDNGGYYLDVSYTGAPVFTVTGDRAQGVWMSHSYCVEGAAFGKGGGEEIVRRLGRWHAACRRENGRWRLVSLRFETLARCVPMLFDRQIHGQAPLWEGGDHWIYPEERENFAQAYPADVYAVQSIFPQWGLRLRRREMRLFPELFFSSDSDSVEVDINTRWSRGVPDLWPRLEEFDRVCRPRQTTSHNTSSPYVVIDESGTHAAAYWLDQGWTNMSAVFGDTSMPLKFMLNNGSYCFEFRKENGAWKVTKIRWKVIYRLPDLRMLEKCRGFCGSDSDELWPLPFDTIRY